MDDSWTIEALLNSALSKRDDFRVVGYCSDVSVAAEMIKRLMPDIVIIDLCMAYLDGAALLNAIRDLGQVCKIIVSDHSARNALLTTKLVEAGAAACLAKSDLVNDAAAFFDRVNDAAARLGSQDRHYLGTFGGKAYKSFTPGAAGTAGFPRPVDEQRRLRRISGKRLANSVAERQFDLITRHVAKVTAYPTCLLTFIDEDTQWIKSSVGFGIKSTPRDQAICNYTISQGGAFVVVDMAADTRFAANPLVTHGPVIRSYAGHPVLGADGVIVGALCVIDNRVRTVSSHVLDQLAGMAAIVGELIDQRPLLAA
ncbi:response regulator [Sphingomonas sp. Tas61C01]|uniref:response regulator n=1 Tax=Sphingomonas sp. Tas61C01 TaxID=3458297 RepID=UPI00403EC336